MFPPMRQWPFRMPFAIIEKKSAKPLVCRTFGRLEIGGLYIVYSLSLAAYLILSAARTSRSSASMALRANK